MAEIGDASASGLRYDALTPADLDEVYQLHRLATDAVGRADLIKPETRSFFERLLDGEGRIIGAYTDDLLVGYGVLQLVLPPSEDARPRFGLGGADVLAKLAGASVLPQEWGRGIHDALIDLRVREAASLGLRHLYATSAPGNARSWENLLDAGFAVRGIVEKYGGNIRYLLYTDLQEQVCVPREGQWIPVGETDLQKEFLGAGCHGVEWRRSSDGGREILYGKPAS